MSKPKRTGKCDECGETATNTPPAGINPNSPHGWALNVAPSRLQWSHTDGTPLCPVMTSAGYQPALVTEDA